MTMTELMEHARKIDAMQEAVLALDTKVNTKLDDQCRKAYTALEDAKSEMIEILYTAIATIKGVA